eukprot:8459644-Pyramimonas_sp.AAC.1
MHRTSKPSSSALKRSNGSWALSRDAKAEVFADCFVAEWSLPTEVQNEFSDLSTPLLASPLPSFLPLRTHAARRCLQQLKEDSGTGPDLIPAIVLKRCSKALSIPLTRLARRIIDSGEWPQCWRIHWIFPIHKRGALSNPDLYRGIQLTAQMSKVLERMLYPHFAPRLES